jgi:hypothetical protein
VREVIAFPVPVAVPIYIAYKKLSTDKELPSAHNNYQDSPFGIEYPFAIMFSLYVHFPFIV